MDAGEVAAVAVEIGKWVWSKPCPVVVAGAVDLRELGERSDHVPWGLAFVLPDTERSFGRPAAKISPMPEGGPLGTGGAVGTRGAEARTVGALPLALGVAFPATAGADRSFVCTSACKYGIYTLFRVLPFLIASCRAASIVPLGWFVQERRALGLDRLVRHVSTTEAKGGGSQAEPQRA